MTAGNSGRVISGYVMLMGPRIVFFVTWLAAILNLGGLLNGSVPPREDLPGTTMIPKRPAAKFDPADLAV
jgi:hypothetical protein